MRSTHSLALFVVALFSLGARPRSFAWPSLQGWVDVSAIEFRANGPAVCFPKGVKSRLTAGPLALIPGRTENPALLAGPGKLLGRWPENIEKRNIKTCASCWYFSGSFFWFDSVGSSDNEYCSHEFRFISFHPCIPLLGLFESLPEVWRLQLLKPDATQPDSSNPGR